MDKKVLILLAVLVVWGFALRVHDLSYHSYWMDESYSVLSAKNIEEYGVPMFDSGVKYFGQMPYTAVLYTATRFGYSESITRFPSVIFGTILIVAIYFFSRRLLKDSYVALIPATLITFSELFIAWSRQARHYSLFVLLFFTSLYMLDVFLSKPTRKNFICLLFSTVLTMMTHPYGMVLLIICFFSFAIHFRKLKGIKLDRKSALLLIPAAAYILFKIMKGLQFLDMQINYLSSYFRFFEQQYFAFFYMSLLGIFLLRKNRDIYPLIAGGIIAFFIHSLLVPLQSYRYLLYLTPFLFIFAAPALAFIPKMFKDKRVAGILMVAILGYAMSYNFIFQPTSEIWLELDTPQPDIRAALHSINVTEDDTIITVYTAATELYLRKPDYWLAFDFSKKGQTGNWLNEEGMDRYTNTTPILGYIQFKEAISSGHGYIIIDEMSQTRIDDEIIADVQSMDVVFSKDDGFWSKIWVYEFKS